MLVPYDLRVRPPRPGLGFFPFRRSRTPYTDPQERQQNQLKSHASLIQQHLDGAREQLAASESSKAQLEGQLEGLQRQHAEVQGHLEEQVGLLSRQTAELERSLLASEQKCEALGSQLSDSRSALEAAEADRRETESQLPERELQQRRLLEAAAGRAELAETELGSERAKADQLSSNLEAANELVREKAVQLEDSLVLSKRAEASLCEANARLQASEQERSVLEASLASCQEQIRALRDEVAEGKRLASEMNEQRALDSAEGSKQLIEASEQRACEAWSALEASKKEIEGLKNERDELIRRLEEASERLLELQRLEEEASASEEETRRISEELRQKSHLAGEEKQRLEADIDSLKEALGVAQAEAEARRLEAAAELSATAASHQAALQQLESQLQYHQSLADEAKEAARGLQGTVGELRVELEGSKRREAEASVRLEHALRGGSSLRTDTVTLPVLEDSLKVDTVTERAMGPPVADLLGDPSQEELSVALPAEEYKAAAGDGVRDSWGDDNWDRDDSWGALDSDSKAKVSSTLAALDSHDIPAVVGASDVVPEIPPVVPAAPESLLSVGGASFDGGERIGAGSNDIPAGISLGSEERLALEAEVQDLRAKVEEKV